VLDLCCGTGKVGAEMARRGYEVVGVDLSEPMTRGCARQQPPLPAAVQDAAQLGFRAESLDLVVSLYDSLNYVLEAERLAACFRDVYAALRPGALLIFDMNTPRALSTDLFSQSNLGSSDPLVYTWKAHWDGRTRLCRVDMWFRWRGDGQDHEITETHWQYAYRPQDVVRMLREAGFSGTAAYEAYSFRPVTRWSDRAYYVARKE
jgi:SAM-dependent methyltransferase